MNGTQKWGGGGWLGRGSFLPFYFHVRAFSIPAVSTILEPGPGYTIVSLFVCFFLTQFGGGSYSLNFDKFRDTAPLIIFICILLIVKKTSQYIRLYHSFFHSNRNLTNTILS